MTTTTHAPNCAREVMRHADDSTAYLSEPCTCHQSQWRYQIWGGSDFQRGAIEIRDTGEIIADLPKFPIAQLATVESRARLIAKAPELYAALKALTDKICEMTSEEFACGGEKPERERALALLAEIAGDR